LRKRFPPKTRALCAAPLLFLVEVNERGGHE
jgi:hypothetical protein